LKFPGDKSISHRALMFAALANGKSIIHNLSTGADVESTRKCLADCGIRSEKDGNSVAVFGGTLRKPEKPLDAGNSGTTARLLTGLLIGQGISAEIIGDKSLSARPMNRIVEPLAKMGAKIESNNGKLPLRFEKFLLHGIVFSPEIASAQVKSAVLFVALGADGKTTIRESFKSRDHTEILLKKLGAEIEISKNLISLEPTKTQFRPFEMTIPGDPSTAAFFAATGVLIQKKEIVLKNVLANPTRIGFFAALEKMGDGIEYLNQREIFGEFVCDMKISCKPLKAIQTRKSDVPRLIDELPIFAVLATQAEGKTTVRGAEELRKKETDRIHAIVVNLRKMGAEIEEFDDGFAIIGKQKLHGAEIQTFDDHRIAMAFTIAGLIADGDVILDNPDCVKISCPEFFKMLRVF